jgi:glycosyltransferase 2 family protein
MHVPSQETTNPDPCKLREARFPGAKRRVLIQIIISIGLTVLIAYLIYRDVPDWRKSLEVMIKGNALLLLAGLIFEFLHLVFRAARWGALLASAKPNIRLKNLFSLTMIKYLINVIPPRSGEIAASMLLARKEHISSATVIAASLFERVMDLISVFVIFAFYLIAFGAGAIQSSEKGEAILLSIRDYSIKGLVVLVIGLAILLFFLRNVHWTARIPPKIRMPILGFLEGFRAIQSQGAMFRVVLFSLAIWLCITLQTWFFVRSYIEDFPLIGTTLLVVMTAIGVAIPTPAGVGGYQYFMSLALISFFSRHLISTDPQSQAAGISNACYLVSMIPVLIAGLVFLNREGLSLGRISKMQELHFDDTKS